MISKVQSILKNKTWRFFLIFWVINILLSVLYKFYYYHTGNHLLYTWMPDMLFFIFMLLAVCSKENTFGFLGVLMLLMFKVVGSLSIASFYPNQLDMYKDVIKTWMGYTYIFPLFLFLSKTKSKTYLRIPDYIIKAFVIIAGTFALSTFIGLIFPSHVFHTYKNPNRFGVSGLLYPSSYVSYFYMISIMLTYLLQEHFTSKKTYTILLYILSLAAIFSGTKSTYLFLILFYITYIIDKKYYTKKWLWMVAVAVIFGLITIRHKLASLFHVLVELYQKEDFITFALSYRNIYAQSTWLFIQENWSWRNYLFGGLDNVNKLTEMAFIDMFLNFGILGVALFLYLYYRLIIRHIKWSYSSFILTTSMVLLIAIGGNFFDRVYLAYWLALLFFLQIRKKDITPEI